jgi:hypothetical protein
MLKLSVALIIKLGKALTKAQGYHANIQIVTVYDIKYK